MERNSNDMPGMNTGGQGSLDGPGGLGNSGNTVGAQGYGTGSSAMPNSPIGGGGTTRTGLEEQNEGVKDRARDMMGNAKESLADAGSTVREKASDVGSTVREKTGTAKNSLADMLETGADKLRQRAHGGTVGAMGDVEMEGAGMAGEASVGGSMSSTAADSRTVQVSDKVAGGMQATADWLRDADLQEMKAGVERQVRDHPGRSLLVALGLGYLVGKAIRR